MVPMLHRLTAGVLGLALIAGNNAICQGAAATPEARMACCADGETCPMHKGESNATVTQAEADSCCAASERETSNPPGATVVAAMSSAVWGSGIVMPVSAPALVLSDGWRTFTPIATAPIPRHVLLSVFLV
jgi:hypothetical protein